MPTKTTAWKRGGQMSKTVFKPLNVGRAMVIDENHKIYGIALELEVERGNLRNTDELLESLGIVTRYIQVSMEETGMPTVNAIAFLDFLKAKATSEEALEILANSYDFVKNAKIIKPQGKGIIFDDYFFPLIAAGERAIIFRKSAYGAFLTA